VLLSAALAAAATLLACNGRLRVGDDDDSAPADDDDASTPGDDDDATTPIGDDDDSSPPSPEAPVIENVSACQIEIVGTWYARFEVSVFDPSGDLVDPTYTVRIDTAAEQQFSVPGDMGNGGVILHQIAIGPGTLPRGTTHDFTFRVADAEAHASEPFVLTWTVPEDEDSDGC
jgi:hypothetical protein